MATLNETALAQEVPQTRRVKWAQARARLRDRADDFVKSRLALVGIVIVALVVAVAVLAPVIERYDPLQQNIGNRLQRPDLQHAFGTDHMGRDVWARIVHGTRIALLVGLIAVGIGIGLGTPIGAISGYYRGKVDEVIMRVMDSLLAFPPILMAIGIVYVPRFARVSRGSVLAEREKEYVEAARMVGESNLSILFRQILPNTLSPLIVQATVFIAYAILTEAALSFLGLGIQPPNPSWGSMLNEAKVFIESDPHLAIVPGLAISITVLGFNLFGDGLRDLLDPRLAKR
jgi:peptide/nickel transport system permease protein